VAPFSVRGLTQSVETLFKEKVREKGLVLKVRVADDVPDTLLGDATRLTQILVNLIGNAIKFSDKGIIELNFFIQELSGRALQLGVRVRDAGIGISEEKLERIFERFNQAEDSITRNYGGTGLGLSIVKTLIQLQQGDIFVKSEPGLGTEFVFYIPYLISEEQIGYEPKPDDEAVMGLINPSLQLLVVDDNIMNQSLMKHFLKQWSVSFTVVSNGLEALDALRTGAFNLVLMDIQMPKMDGYTATRHIRDDLKLEIPIIAMTAHAMAGEREKCISHGMNEYISKPVNEEMLFKLISRFIAPNSQWASLIPATRDAHQYTTIDLSYMRSVSKGNSAYENKVAEQFISCLPADMESLLKALEGRDTAEMNRVAHNMKTTVAIMGLLPVLEQQLDRLENADTGEPGLATVMADIRRIGMVALQEAGDFKHSLRL
jgi:CheY-like chemotaxis protein